MSLQVPNINQINLQSLFSIFAQAKIFINCFSFSKNTKTNLRIATFCEIHFRLVLSAHPTRQKRVISLINRSPTVRLQKQSAIQSEINLNFKSGNINATAKAEENLSAISNASFPKFNRISITAHRQSRLENIVRASTMRMT